jgi:hypothetical protein
MKHLFGIGFLLATALLLRFRFHVNRGFTYWTNDAPTRFISYNSATDHDFRLITGFVSLMAIVAN